MDESKKKALRQCHPDLRTSKESPTSYQAYTSMQEDSLTMWRTTASEKRGTCKASELMDIFLKKESKTLNYFFTVLEKEGYKAWSDKLREATGLAKRQLSCIVTLGPFYFCQTCLLRCLLC